MTRPDLPSLDDVSTWTGRSVLDALGSDIGACRSVYADDSTGLPEWVEVSLTDGGTAFVPTLGATQDGDTVRLAHPAQLVTDSPRFPTDVSLQPADERALYTHYGLEVSSELSDSLLPAAAESDDAGPTPPTSAATPPTAAVPPTTDARPVTPPPVAPPYPVTAPPQAASASGKPTPLIAAGAAAVAAVALLVVRRRRSRRHSW